MKEETEFDSFYCSFDVSDDDIKNPDYFITPASSAIQSRLSDSLIELKQQGVYMVRCTVSKRNDQQ